MPVPLHDAAIRAAAPRNADLLSLSMSEMDLPGMPNELIELTQVKITSGKMTAGFKKMIACDHIFSIEPGAQDTALITLANGDKIMVKETYSELKARFGMTSR